MRKLAGVLLVAAMVSPFGLAGSPAGAANQLKCTKLAGTATWTPPVSPTVSVPHTVTSKLKLSGCTGVAGITSGAVTFTSKGTKKQNCKDLLAGNGLVAKSSESVTWSNKKTSVVPKVSVTFVRAATLKISGKITGGTQTAFKGKAITFTGVLIPNGGGCLKAGVSLKTATASIAKGTTGTVG